MSPDAKPVNEDAILATYTAIGSVGLFGNLLVIIVIFLSSSMRKKLTNMFIINQSMIDFVASVFILIFGVVSFDGYVSTAGNLGDELLCKFMVARVPLWTMMTSSTCNLVALTLERYMAVVHPIAHKMKFTKTKALITITAIWIFGPAYMLTNIFSSEIRGQVCIPLASWPSQLAQVLLIVVSALIHYLIPRSIMVFSYARIISVLRGRVDAIRDSSTVTTSARVFQRSRRNSIKTLFFVSVCYVLCWTCNIVVISMYMVGYPVDLTSPFYHFTIVAVFCNSCLNPFIYIFQYEEFKSALRRLVQNCTRRTNSVSTENVTTVTSNSISA